jgi:hypothetical protein
VARLAVDKDFNYSKRDKSVQEAIDKFAAYTHAGLQLGKINYCKDYRIRAIRIDLSWPGRRPGDWRRRTGPGYRRRPDRKDGDRTAPGRVPGALRWRAVDGQESARSVMVTSFTKNLATSGRGHVVTM